MSSDAPGDSGFEAPPDLESRALVDPEVLARNKSRVRRSFWRKLRRVMGRIPFAEDAVAMYYCALDPATPLRVRATLYAALAYFVLPLDMVPDFIAGFGFTDDIAVLTAALAAVRGSLAERHYIAARKSLSTDENTTRNV